MKLNSNDKKQMLHQEYIFLLQLIADYNNRQLFLKYVLLTLVAGSIALMLSTTLHIFYSFPVAALTASVDILAAALVGLLLPAVIVVVLSHERYEHGKRVCAFRILAIEDEFAANNRPLRTLSPYSIRCGVLLPVIILTEA